MKLRFTRRAIAHFSQLERDMLAAFGGRVAGKFLARIEHAAQNLTSFPFSSRPGRVGETCEIPVPNAPFVIAYQIKDDEVHSLAVHRGPRSLKPVIPFLYPYAGGLRTSADRTWKHLQKGLYDVSDTNFPAGLFCLDIYRSSCSAEH